MKKETICLLFPLLLGVWLGFVFSTRGNFENLKNHAQELKSDMTTLKNQLKESNKQLETLEQQLEQMRADMPK